LLAAGITVAQARTQIPRCARDDSAWGNSTVKLVTLQAGWIFEMKTAQAGLVDVCG